MSLPRTAAHRLLEQAEQLGDRPALWTQRAGVDVPLSWRQYAHQVKRLALGLLRLGVVPGEAVGLWSASRIEWPQFELAAQAIGARVVGLGAEVPADRVLSAWARSNVSLGLVDSAERVSELLPSRRRLPGLRTMVWLEDERGAEAIAAAVGRSKLAVLSWSELLASVAEVEDAPFFERLNAVQAEDVAAVVYGDGGDGSRAHRGVKLSHRNLAWTGARLYQSIGVEESAQAPEGLQQHSLLVGGSLGEVGERLRAVHGAVMCGVQVFFPRPKGELLHDLRRVRPTLFFGAAWVWERIIARFEHQLAARPPHELQVYAWARRTALKRHTRELDGERVPTSLELQFLAAQRLVLDELKHGWGLDRAALFTTGAERLSREALELLLSLDLVVREMYGVPEATGLVSINVEGATRLDTRGRPLAGMEVRIDGNGELLIRGENAFVGYEEGGRGPVNGWVALGKKGSIDPDGFLNVGS